MSQRQPGLEAVDIRGDRVPVRLGGDQGFDPGPLAEGDLDRIGAAQALEQFEQILLEKRRIHAEFQPQSASQARMDLADQFAHKALGALGVMDIAGTVLEPEDLPGLGQVSEPRIVTDPDNGYWRN